MKNIIRIICIISICIVPTATIKTIPSSSVIIGSGILAGALSYKFPKAIIITALSLQTFAASVIGLKLLDQSKKEEIYTPQFREKCKKGSALYLGISAFSLAGLIGYIVSPYSKG